MQIIWSQIFVDCSPEAFPLQSVTPTRTQVQVRYALTDVQRHEDAIAARRHRLGGRVQVTNAPVDRLPLPQAVQHYRGGWSLERDFHLVKDLPLGLSPLFVWKSEQIIGLTRLLT